MAEASIDTLITAESRLTRSFVGAAATFLLSTVWTISFARPTPSGGVDIGWLGVVLLLLQFGCYVWYAVAAGSAAKALGDRGWKYTVWILVAPILGLLPIPVVSTVINASPLSIKFLLGGQLQTAIREASFADLHQGV
jgi:hypothetical protein